MIDPESTNTFSKFRIFSGNSLANLISSGFGSGLVKVAPGTVGSIAWLLIFVAAEWINGTAISIQMRMLFVPILFILGLLAVRISLRASQSSDPGWIVIDEWCGLSAALLFTPSGWMGNLAAFLFFRLFDVLKPYPITLFERLPGSLGVMADDVIAGLLAGALGLVTLGYLL